MAKILVVDDEADLELLMRQKFRRKIRESVYEFVFAENGEDALKKIRENPDLDIVLSDINMPVMDGLTLLNKLTDVNPLLKTVMVSAYGDMQNIRTAMNRGAFDFVFKPVDFDDLDLTMEKTIRHVKELQQTLKAIKENNILKMYVDENVLNFMTHKEFEKDLMQNEQIDATVMFVDVCSFTSITEHVQANAVVLLLNQLFDKIVREIIAQNGHVDKFIGDAVMAVFTGENHLKRAVQAALAARAEIRSIEEVHAETRSFKPQVSIGINTGEMISGNIGSVSLKRLDYTVIGDVVNTAQRLQSAARADQILVNEATFNQIKTAFNFENLGERFLKNKAAAAVVYQVLD